MTPMIEETGGLHPKRRRILEILARRFSRGEGVPTEREIGLEMGYKSSQTVHHHLVKLVEEGYVERGGSGGQSGKFSRKQPVQQPRRSGHSHRTLSLTERGWETVGETVLMGRIAAGRGMSAVADGEAYALAGELLTARSGRQRYLLRVVGQSMVGASIHDGDLVVVEEDPDPADGAIVVALLAEDEVTVKRLYRKNSHILLVAESPDHENIEVGWGEVQVQGRVMYVIHAAS